MSVFECPSYDNHRSLIFITDPEVGLKAIIALHKLYDNRAAGGVRFWPFATEADAIKDVLRLSRGMTYKFALANMPLGGGKTVIIGDPRKLKTPALLTRYAQFVHNLGGKYTCGADIGTNADDIALIGKTTPYALGQSGQAGDPSPATAFGVYQGILAALAHKRGSDSLEGVHVAVQGLGSVGRHLCGLLVEAGARLTVADINNDAVEATARELGADQCAPEGIWALECDVFAPCAVGGGINDQTVDGMGAEIICGAANNQLMEDSHGQRLHENGVLFVPDYAVNSGGAIKCTMEGPDYDEDLMFRKVERVRSTIEDILEMAARENLPTSIAADRLAEARMEKNASHYA